MQVYADLRILTARPTPDEEAAAPHHLFGVADAAEPWSVGRWLRAVTSLLAEIAARERPAIIVGGTGLYFRALTVGLAEIPAVSSEVRTEVKALYERLGEDALRALLAKVDPLAAGRIARADKQRLIRAYEVYLGSGRALTEWQSGTRPTLAPGAWRGLVLEPPRATLYDRCDARLAAMVDQGALDEVARLAARDLTPDLPVMKALGVARFAAHLRGEGSLADALALTRADTRRYAKRQITWFRTQTPDWPRSAEAATIPDDGAP